jgi:hypothetical protein
MLLIKMVAILRSLRSGWKDSCDLPFDRVASEIKLHCSANVGALLSIRVDRL